MGGGPAGGMGESQGGGSAGGGRGTMTSMMPPKPVDAGSEPTADAKPSIGDGAVTCPAGPPFQDNLPALAPECVRRVLVVTGNARRRIASFDQGVTWVNGIEAPAGGNEDENSLNSVAFGLGWVVAVGTGGVLRSSDAKTWTQVPGLPTRAGSVAFGNGRFVIVSSDAAYWSTDGTKWTKQSLPSWSGHLHGVAFGNDRIVAMGDNAATISSADGAVSWMVSKLGDYPGYLGGVAFGNGVFVAVGIAPGGLRGVSNNGLQWSSVKTGTYDFAAITFDGQKFVGVGRAPASTVDGVTWTALQTNRAVDDVVFAGGQYIGPTGQEVYKSKDARTWTQAYKGGTYSLRAVASGYLTR